MLLFYETYSKVLQDGDDCDEGLELMTDTEMTELNECGDYTDCELQELLQVQRRTRVCTNHKLAMYYFIFISS